ncbi:hypothetical protein Tco_0642986, partial [Tanacetum coccineum]
MDSMIPNGQKNTLAEYMIVSGADNRSPMLDKDLYDSWKSRMELYMQNREHGRIILESVEHGPLIWPTIEENRVTRTKKYVELSTIEKNQADCDLKATNIILQGLPSDIYSFVNHHRVAKDLWEKVQLLMQVHQDPYPQPQYVPQIEYTVSTVNQQTHLAEFPQIDSGLAVPVFKQDDDPIDVINKMMSFLSTVVSSRFPTPNNQLRNSSNPRQQATIYDGRVTVQPVQGRQNSFVADSAAYQADDLDVYDYGCDEISTAKAVLMANLSSYGLDVLSKVPHSNHTHNDMLNQIVQEMPYSKQTRLMNYPKNEITSDSNIIPYSQCLLETQNAVVHDTNYLAQQDAMILSVFEQLSNQVTNCNKVNEDNLIANETLSAELERYKERVKFLEERQNIDLEKEARNIDKEIALEKKVKELDNIVCKMGQSAQTVHMITKPQVFYDNNLKQALGFQNPFYLKKAQQIRLMLYDGSVIAKETNVISIADSEETLMLEEESQSKMLLKQSDPMVLEKKVNIKPINYAELNRLSKDFGKRFIPQQELMNKLSDENTSVKVNSSVAMIHSVNYVEMYNKCLELEAELIKQHNMVEKDEYNRLSKRFSELEQHCISLEIEMQLNKEIFQKNNTSVNQTEPLFDQLFALNNLKAELQAKDTTIKKLKAHIKRVNETSTSESVKRDLDEIETINIELEHRVTKIIVENEHLKQTYKQLYDSIKPSRVRAKKQTESLVNQVNQKSIEISDLNAQLQEKVFVITALKNNLRKLKGKEIDNNAAQMSNVATIAPGMYKLDPVILAPKVKNNREAHEYYLKHTMEQAAILRK